MIESPAELDYWFAFAADYADNNNSNNRNQFDSAAQAAVPIPIEDSTTDEVIVLEGTPFAPLLNRIRNADAAERTAHLAELQATWSHDAYDWLPDGKELDELNQDDYVEYGMIVGGRFLIAGRGAGDPRPNINAYIAHWRKQFGPQNINQIEARAVYDRQFAEMEELNVFSSVYDPDYVDATDAIEELSAWLNAHDNDINDFPVTP